MTYLLLVIFLGAARAADLLSTFLATPDLRREFNPLIRALGWRLTLCLNAFAIVYLPACFPRVAVAIAVLSLLACAWNVWRDHKRNNEK